jgi:hypothetical protein
MDYRDRTNFSFFYMVMIRLQHLYGSLEAADRIRVS